MENKTDKKVAEEIAVAISDTSSDFEETNINVNIFIK